jgi:hypothetical protein
MGPLPGDLGTDRRGVRGDREHGQIDLHRVSIPRLEALIGVSQRR